jgi:hypothetical protein
MRHVGGLALDTEYGNYSVAIAQVETKTMLWELYRIPLRRSIQLDERIRRVTFFTLMDWIMLIWEGSYDTR